MRKLKK